MHSTTYLVTGGAGFIGSHLAKTLLDLGASVRVFDNLDTSSEANLAVFEGRAEFRRGDLRHFESVKDAMEGVEVVFHQGAVASVPRSIAEPVSSLQTTINGTQNVLLAARDAGVRRVVFASSSAI